MLLFYVHIRQSMWYCCKFIYILWQNHLTPLHNKFVFNIILYTHTKMKKEYFTTSTIKHEALIIILCHLLWRLFCRLAKKQPSGNSSHEKHSWKRMQFLHEETTNQSYYLRVDPNKWNRLLCIHESCLSVLAVFGLQFMKFSLRWLIYIPWCTRDGNFLFLIFNTFLHFLFG